MFTNLIESNADRSAFKRRSSFFLITITAYCLILFAAGIVGVLTYDAQVEAQNSNLLVDYWIPPVVPVADAARPRETRPIRPAPRANAPVDPNIRVSERTVEVAPANDPTKIPESVGIKGSDVPLVTGPVVLSTR